ncbi:DUF6044 family protein [Magnetospirillum sp. UT-4]|uniref:DUF6044 family protein n=1 Tax=Magnetospirillum sp. UT-4 TaxID=2681467 RepID=UPI0015746BA2|nr:DUF6044 family protein [Magnetospirillum sp. UT-4]
MTRAAALSRREIVVVAALCLWSAAFFLILGESSFVLSRNEAAGAVAQLLAHRWEANATSFWASYASAGNDVLAMGKAPWLARLLFAHVPGWVAYVALHLLQNAAAVAGTYLLARHPLGLGRTGATFAAVSVGAAVSLAGLYLGAVHLIPLLIVAMRMPVERPRSPLAWAVAMVVTGLYAHLCVVNYLFVFPAAFAVLWFAVAERLADWRRWIPVLVLCLLMHLLRWQDVLALAYTVPLSDRVDKPMFDTTLWQALVEGVQFTIAACLHPGNAVVVLPYPYITVHKILVVMIAVLVWFAPRTGALRRSLALGAAVLAVQAVLPFAAKAAGTVVAAANTFSANKLVEFFLFPAALAAGAIVDGMAGRWGRVARWAPAALLAATTLGNGAYATHQWLTQGSWRHIFGSPVIAALAERVHASGEPARVASFRMYDDYVQAYGLDSVGGYHVMVPNRFFKFWLSMSAAEMEADPSLRTMHSDGATFYFGVVGAQRDDQAERRFGERYNLAMLSLMNMRYVLSRDRLTDPEFRQLELSDPKRPWSDLSAREKLAINARANLSGRTHLYVYENTRALPRFFLAQALVPVASADEINARLSTEPLETLSRQIYVARGDLPPGAGMRQFTGTGTVTPVAVGGDRVELDVALDGPALLFASNAHSPFWRCAADGAEIPVLPGHGAFWAMELPASAGRVSCAYRPPYRPG